MCLRGILILMSELTGYVDHIIYRNAANAYTVLVLIPEDEPEEESLKDEGEVSVTGIFPSISEGENIHLTGEYRMHESFGMQFAMRSYEVVAPKDEESMRRYLGSGAIKGVGAALAKRIVEKFGKDTFKIMEIQPERLAEVRGISEKKAREIASQMVQKRDQREVMLQLSKLGVTTNMSVKIYNHYGQAAMDAIRENPYRLAEEVEGIGFHTADEIASKLGFQKGSEFRMQSGLLYALEQAAMNGNTYLPKEELTLEAARLLAVDPEMLEVSYESLVMNRKLKILGDQVSSMVMYRMEERAAGMLLNLNERFVKDPALLTTQISDIEKEEGMTLDVRQREAVEGAANHGVFVLTGGPGTGKTTTIKAIIRYFEREGLTIRLAAPTGRAAKRMSEACGQEAQTIHRLLEVNGSVIAGEQEEDGKVRPGTFQRNEENPLEADVVIIDEMSMVDISLMYALLRAVAEGTRLVMVGDVDQLPSVGPGNVLKDIIASGAFCVVTLTNVFRQNEAGDIVLNAHRIHKGEPVTLDNKSRDFFFLKRYDVDHILKVVMLLVQEKLPGYVNAGPYDIQILTPSRKGLLGVENLNPILQKYLNPPDEKKAEHSFGTFLIREGDKVMQTKNDYQMEWQILGKYGITIEKGTGIFNGDIGIVEEVNDFNSTLRIRFDDGHMVDYPYKQVDQLELAYAMTIHKSQGSEYPAVVMPLLSGPRMLYNRNLLYTAVTRAKNCVVIVGDEKVFYDMEQNNQQQRRYSALEERIREQSQLLDA